MCPLLMTDRFWPQRGQSPARLPLARLGVLGADMIPAKGDLTARRRQRLLQDLVDTLQVMFARELYVAQHAASALKDSL